jgi:Putative transposase
MVHGSESGLPDAACRRGTVGEPDFVEVPAPTDEALQAAAPSYRVNFGPRAGQNVPTLQGSIPIDTDFEQPLCADISGFTLQAAVSCAADDRQALEQSRRHITRPALGNERVQTNAAGQVVLKLKTARRDGTTHRIVSPMEFMQGVATLVPRPRLGLIQARSS